MIGNTIIALVKQSLESINEIPKRYEGKVIYENDHFMTIKTKHYQTSINKVDIYTGLATIKVISCC